MPFEPEPLAIYLNMPQISVYHETCADVFSARWFSCTQNNGFSRSKIVSLLP